MAISPDSKKIVTGGQEKKVRIFDLQKSDAQPTLLSDAGSISHDGTVKSVVWFDVNTVATASEDGTIKYASDLPDRELCLSAQLSGGGTCGIAGRSAHLPFPRLSRLWSIRRELVGSLSPTGRPWRLFTLHLILHPPTA